MQHPNRIKQDLIFSPARSPHIFSLMLFVAVWKPASSRPFNDFFSLSCGRNPTTWHTKTYGRRYINALHSHATVCHDSSHLLFCLSLYYLVYNVDCPRGWWVLMANRHRNFVCSRKISKIVSLCSSMSFPTFALIICLRRLASIVPGYPQSSYYVPVLSEMESIIALVMYLSCRLHILDYVSLPCSQQVASILFSS